MERCGRKLKLLMFVVVPRYICNLESPVWDWNWLNIARSKISSPNFPSAVGSSCVFIFLPNLNLTIPFQSWIPAIPSIQEWSLYLFDFWGGRSVECNSLKHPRHRQNRRTKQSQRLSLLRCKNRVSQSRNYSQMAWARNTVSMDSLLWSDRQVKINRKNLQFRINPARY